MSFFPAFLRSVFVCMVEASGSAVTVDIPLTCGAFAPAGQIFGEVFWDQSLNLATSTECDCRQLWVDEISHHCEAWKWFEEQYLTAPWEQWWCGASNTPGVTPNNNPIEIFWRSREFNEIKK